MHTFSIIRYIPLIISPANAIIGNYLKADFKEMYFIDFFFSHIAVLMGFERRNY